MTIWQFLLTVTLGSVVGYHFGWLAREQRLTEHERRAEQISQRWHRP